MVVLFFFGAMSVGIRSETEVGHGAAAPGSISRAGAARIALAPARLCPGAARTPVTPARRGSGSRCTVSLLVAADFIAYKHLYSAPFLYISKAARGYTSAPL